MIAPLQQGRLFRNCQIMFEIRRIQRPR